ncbi:putative U2 auxiliary factor small subunit [Helianthus anomalus]
MVILRIVTSELMVRKPGTSLRKWIIATGVITMVEHLAFIFGTEKDRVKCPFYFKIGA